ncbi:RICIN domain-containing protein [filamentous cyanobacterium LEGE 11480]|uniref:RICIN domain-containing protein n=1 Tax=Romeriopsis navalis LEGE 11480 TaxID=2777977 RepID=A0A928VHD2_9CYAN|nr:RICIN domain-containing protein [Romeriopsis navalis]MBE9028641.1 RICIN domain-containing protein [Romeriopsis navalis LEGE 11480]
MTPKLIIVTSMVLILGCAPQADQAKVAPQSEPAETAPKADQAKEASQSDQVEIALTDKLDSTTNNYCLDIAGGNKNIDITKGLQGHTCYSYRGSLGADQVFDPGRFAQGELYMPNFKVCATLSALQADAKVGLAPCDSSELQQFAFKGEGTITPKAAPDMCLTLATATRTGRSKQHQIKALQLVACDSQQSKYQTWRARTSMD